MSDREPVDPSVYEGIDFDEFNRGIAKYREILRTKGFDAALSHYAGTPTVAVFRDPDVKRRIESEQCTWRSIPKGPYSPQ